LPRRASRRRRLEGQRSSPRFLDRPQISLGARRGAAEEITKNSRKNHQKPTGGLATQGLHNAALTAGRLAEAGEAHGSLAALRACAAEHGARALYLNIQYRVGVIAVWTAILNLIGPFDKS